MRHTMAKVVLTLFKVTYNLFCAFKNIHTKAMTNIMPEFDTVYDMRMGKITS